MKSFLKEIIIILLLCLIICLILGITFYKYIPNTKIVPSEVEKYKTSETIKDEIEQRRDLAPKTEDIISNKTYVDYAVYAKYKGKIKM